MRVPDDLRRAPAFVCIKEGDKFIYCGTAFYLSYCLQGVYSYLVTARHCVEKGRAYGELLLCVNDREEGARYYEIGDDWVFGESDADDLAVMYVEAGLLFANDVPAIFIDEFVATDELIDATDLGPGDDVIISGLFTRRPGRELNIPIIRSGMIAAMPDEPLQDDQMRDYDAYLVETRSIGGLSGSPVFADLRQRPTQVDGSGKGTIQPELFLIGLVRGHWNTLKNETTDSLGDELALFNMGISIVTPIQKVVDTIKANEAFVALRDGREKVWSEYNKKRPLKTHEGGDRSQKRADMSHMKFGI